MTRKVKIFVLIIILVVVATLFHLLILPKIKFRQTSDESAEFDKLSKLIDIADSVRNSSPDSAMADYKKVIASLQSSANEKTKMHLIAKSYVGIANINSEAGDYKLALNNDSISMAYATEFDDKQAQAKATVMRGTTLYRKPSVNPVF